MQKMSRPCIPWPALAVLCSVMMICGAPFLPRCEGCTHEEWTALMEFRSQIHPLEGLYLEKHGGERDCCRWYQVTCNPRTGRVTGLAEFDMVQDNAVDSMLLNATVFLPLQELRELSLNSLRITGCIPGAGFEVLSKLRKLEMLDLTSNGLNDSSISSLAAVSSVRYLFLDYNALSSAQTIQQLSIMQLETLDISGNAMNGTVSTDICNMKSLHELYLRDNMLFGELPLCIGNLTSLRVLDLSNNLLTVKFPSFSFNNLKSLVKISIANNNLEGNLSVSSLSNHSLLRYVELASSGNYFQLLTENPAKKISGQLEFLVLRNCNLNGNASVILCFLVHQCALGVIDMSNNNLSGYFPSWLIENNTNLSFLILQGNNFSGHLSLLSKVHKNLKLLDASRNRLIKFPIDINITLSNLNYLNLSGNSFDGPFPSAFRYMADLITLDLSCNNFLDNIGAAFKSSISSLFLSLNSFYGSLRNLSKTHFHLMLNDNRITGKIPETICHSELLSVLDFSKNELTGSLPACAIQSLSILNLRGNSLVGPIPSEFCNFSKLVFIDLSKNNLSGPIHCLPDVQYLHLSENRFNGTFPFPLSMGTDIRTVDLRGNQFSGVLPRLTPKAFPKLRILLLERNLFHGMIPSEICRLIYLSLLDLSHNKLSGKLPSCLSDVGSDGELFDFQYSDNSTIFGEMDPGDYLYRLSQSTEFILQPDQDEFITKSRQDFYKGKALNYMSGFDFSSNQLSGSIPESIGNMTWLRVLNFSKNYLNGSIPWTLSNLSKLESLDLSHNNLAGQIPSELVALQSLEVFSVAYNNLSGPTLGTKGQFITFDQSSYEGNPYLCGLPLLKSCSRLPSTPRFEEHGEEDDDSVSDIILFGCSAMFYLVGFWTSLGVLYFKTNWRWLWFSGVDRFGDFVMVKLFVFLRKIPTTN